MKILDFLRARLDDDERVAREAEDNTSLSWGEWPFWIDVDNEHGKAAADAWRDRFSPKRLLHEVAAKRLLLDDITAERHLVVDGDGWFTCAAATEDRDGGTCHNENAGDKCDCGRDARVERRLRLLALPYSDHPDYRPESVA